MADRVRFIRSAADKISLLAKDLPEHVPHVDTANFSESKALKGFGAFLLASEKVPSGTELLEGLRQVFGDWASIEVESIQRGRLGINAIVLAMKRVKLSKEEETMKPSQLETLMDELEAWLVPLRLTLRKIM